MALDRIMFKSDKYNFLLTYFLLTIILLQLFLIQTNYSNKTDEFSKQSPYFEAKIEQIKEVPKVDENKIHLFKEIALKHGTDKVTTHHYEYLYGQILGPLRLQKLNFLEIGLGCDMKYGPGKSIPLWKEFLPCANISILEYNEKCALLFKSQVEKLFTGDQSDINLMKKIGEEGGPYHVVVDDGGHTRKQQINSLIGLWPFVTQNGGIYIIEDIFTSFVKSYNDNPNESTIDLMMELIVILNDPSKVDYGPPHILPNINISKHAAEISSDLMSVNCFERACVLIKK